MRRPNGSGTIVKLSGNRRRPYAVRIPGRDKFGQVVQRALSYHTTAREAQEALDEYNRSKVTGVAPAPDMLSITVQQVYDGWSGRTYQKLKPASVTSHKAAWNKRISSLASVKIRNVSIDEWQSILDHDEANGLSQSLINNDAILIKALCAYAMERDIIAKDYSAYLEIPSVDPKRKKGAFTDQQMKKLEQMVKEDFPWADTALMLCYTGFRISEFLDLTKASFHAENGGYLQGGIKTEAGKDRIVPVHQKIMPYLKRWLDNGTEYIVTRNGDRMHYLWYRANAFPAIVEALGVPDATPHWCRHTFATMAHAAGMDPLAVKWIMGHSTNQDITEHYTHETIGVLRREIDKLS